MQEMTWDQICRRAGGRRRYNAWRAFKRTWRRAQIVEALDSIGMGWGYQARLAAHFGVSEATISRDLAAINAEWQRRYR